MFTNILLVILILQILMLMHGLGTMNQNILACARYLRNLDEQTLLLRGIKAIAQEDK